MITVINMKILIYYEDDNIIVCEKPRGVISQKSDKNCMPGLLSRQSGAEIYPVHRLDTDTTGVMVFAKNKKTARFISKQIENRTFKKQYLAKLENLPLRDSGTLTDLLYYDRKANKSYVVKWKRNGVKEAELSYRVEDCENRVVSVFLKTGRTHQIRVQFSNIGCPIVGDRRYGSRTAGRIHLHCHRIEFLDFDGEIMSFSSLPDWE